jgi:hypothetical protein
VTSEEKKTKDVMLRTTNLTPIFAFILWGATSGPWGSISIGLFDLRAAFAGFALAGLFTIWIRQIAYWIKIANAKE